MVCGRCIWSAVCQGSASLPRRQRPPFRSRDAPSEHTGPEICSWDSSPLASPCPCPDDVPDCGSRLVALCHAACVMEHLHSEAPPSLKTNAILRARVQARLQPGFVDQSTSLSSASISFKTLGLLSCFAPNGWSLHLRCRLQRCAICLFDDHFPISGKPNSSKVEML